MQEASENVGEIARAVASLLEQEGNVRAVFGAPIKLEERTIVPVATVAMGGGGGGVRALGAAVKRWLWTRSTDVEPSRTFVGGGGLGVDVRPLGFLHEEDGHVVFTRIDDGRHRESK